MAPTEENSKCFVISPIGTNGTDGFKRAKNVLTYVILPAAEEVGLEAVRADDLSQPGSVATQIIQQLISAKMVVADLTELNPNVFYELAIRDSFGLPVVLIAEEGTVLPFDVIQQRTIFFDSGDLDSAIPARDRIAKALKEALADPSAGSPVKAAVDLGDLRSGNPEERQVAELAEHVARLSQEVASLRQEEALKQRGSRSFATGEMPSLRHIQLSRLRSAIGKLSDEELAEVLIGGSSIPPMLDEVDARDVRSLVREELSRRGALDQ